MKVVTPEIVWHGKEPVFSADFHRRGDNWRLATGGADNNVRVRTSAFGRHFVELAKSQREIRDDPKYVPFPPTVIWVCIYNVCLCRCCADVEGGARGWDGDR